MKPVFAGLTEDEADVLLRMTTRPEWAVFCKYLDFQEHTAVQKGMALGHSPEKSGYFKGIYGLARDIQDLPLELNRIVAGFRPADDGFVSLDGADAP